jgi:hypothetical protein
VSILQELALSNTLRRSGRNQFGLGPRNGQFILSLLELGLMFS